MKPLYKVVRFKLSLRFQYSLQQRAQRFIMAVCSYEGVKKDYLLNFNFIGVFTPLDSPQRTPLLQIIKQTQLTFTKRGGVITFKEHSSSQRGLLLHAYRYKDILQLVRISKFSFLKCYLFTVMYKHKF